MTSPKINAITDIILTAVFLVLAISGLILKFILPRGAGNLTALSIERHEWLSIHSLISIIFIIFLILHLLLHWRWILCIPKFFRNSKKCKDN